MGEAKRRRERTPERTFTAAQSAERAEKRRTERELRKIAAAVTPKYVREAPGIGRARRRQYDREHRGKVER